MTDLAPTLPERIQDVLRRFHQACEQAGRDPSEVTLLAVSKWKPASAIRTAWEHGLRQFGESYVQEWKDKRLELEDLEAEGLKWHIIGHLQRNKCKYIAGEVSLIHSVDSMSLLNEINRRTPEGSVQSVLLQFNVGQEDSKSGFVTLDDAREALQQDWPRLSIDGLMTLPPYMAEPEEVRPFFRQLHEWRERLRQEFGLPFPHLSMGMSHDLEVAIAEGSTCVRVGTAIFGPRES
ncbi:MAG: YggS family pyridoxal phosphate-dependent enzyme [Deltaproteobacteria bacterium]|nr:MAG: YggS family pyridoxal phosphate-dependent enzyme [Deltaproteobacteria bacterium]